MFTKNVSDVTLEDWIKFPVWEFTNDDEETDDLLVRPVTELPVTDMSGRLVSTKVRFANGMQPQAVLDNLDLDNAETTKHFLGISIFWGKEQFSVSRYFDPDYHTQGPSALAGYLCLDVTAIFPISYDVSDFCIGKDSVVRGFILAEPAERLTDSQIMNLVSKH